MSDNNKNFSKMIIFLALFLLMGYIEAIIPFNFGFLGIKLGLSNLVFLVSLNVLGPKKSVILSFLRVLIINILFADTIHFSISFTGFLLSSFIMALMFNYLNISIILLSIYGAVFHILGQYIAVIFIIKNLKICKLIPISIAISIICGFLIGVLAKIILKNPLIKNNIVRRY